MNPRRMLATIERVLPGLSRRDWGAIAIEAARLAGLDGPDLASLRTNLHNEWACRADSPPPASAGPR